jgi:predicted acetyltransferase
MKICNHCGIDFYQDLYPTPENALDTIVKHAKGVDLHANFFPYCTHFCIQDGEILGAIRLRLGSNAFIKQEIGHIGYETKPSARGKGVAKALLMYVKDQLLIRPVMIICDASNIASTKVIRYCGGILLEDKGTDSDAILRFSLSPSSMPNHE